jgi:hypothetical protein
MHRTLVRLHAGRRNIFFVLFLFVLFSAGHSTLKAGALRRPDKLPFEVRRELDEARGATARYRDVDQAIADGYVDINVFVPGQGFHYLKPALMDAEFQADKPEILVYAVDPERHHLRLVAIEYAVPHKLAAVPPEGFTGNLDRWDLNPDFDLWTLHCWAWLENPNGLFAEVNPRVP